VISASNTSSWVSYNLYPEYEVIFDTDHDYLEDNIELEIAEKFKPVLHKHSYDLQQGLANLENYIVDGKFNLKVWTDQPQLAFDQQVSGDSSALHKWYIWHWDTYGKGSQSQAEQYNLNLNNSYRYSAAPTGQRPLYYHVYKNEGESYYYVQYWYYFGMNDLREQIPDTWHESDWEHVSIRLIKDGDTYIPDKVNFYLHDGGKTYSDSQCWWSSTNSLSYNGIQQGYDESHTHLHIWIAANAHASYNRYSRVYSVVGWVFGSLYRTYKDRLDYEPSNYDLYFNYDTLIKLGEISKQATIKCPDSGYTLSFHCYPTGPGSKHWLAYRGRMGDYDGDPGAAPPPPFMPAKEVGLSHEWRSFTVGNSFGNNGDVNYIVIIVDLCWIIDNGVGD